MSNPFTRGVIPLKVLLSHYTLYDPILRCVIPLQVVILLHMMWSHYAWCDPITHCVIPLQVFDPITRGLIPLHVVWSHYTWCDPIARGVIPFKWCDPITLFDQLQVVWSHYTLCDPITRGVIRLHEVWSPNTWLGITDINVIMNVIFRIWTNNIRFGRHLLFIKTDFN